MGMYLEIRKIKTEKNVHYYSVRSSNSVRINAYIGIDSAEKKLFFVDQELKKIIKEIDLKNPNQIVGDLPNLRDYLIVPLVSKVVTALRSNTFPEILDYCA
jgi:hypothetical protein